MAALKKMKSSTQEIATAATAPDAVRPIADGHVAKPIASPAHKLQQALEDAGYRSEGYRERPMSNAMLVLSLICVYALSMLMFFGSLAA